MTFKTSLTVLIFFIMTDNVSAAEGVSEVIDKTSGNYIVFLSEKSALDTAYNSQGVDRQVAIAKITTQQNAFMAVINRLDENIIVQSKTKLVENSIHLHLPHRIISNIKNNKNVVKVIEVFQKPALSSHYLQPSRFQDQSDKSDDITVAVIGNGVNYTGQNVTNSAVIGGINFSFRQTNSQSSQNILTEDTSDINVIEGLHPSGTLQAALILEQAPNAKILAYKIEDWNWAQFYPFIDLILDPNQDGILIDTPSVLLINSYGNSNFRQREHDRLIVEHISKISNLGLAIIVPNNQTDALFSNVLSKKVISPNNDLMKKNVLSDPNITSKAAVGDNVMNGYLAAYLAGLIAKLKSNNPDIGLNELEALVMQKTNSINYPTKADLLTKL